MRQPILNSQFNLFHGHGCAGGGDDEHGTIASGDGLVVEVDANDAVCTHLFGTFLHFGEGFVAGIDQFALVAGRAATEDVAQACAEIFQKVDTCHDLAKDDAVIVGDAMTLKGRSGGDVHSVFFRCFTE